MRATGVGRVVNRASVVGYSFGDLSSSLSPASHRTI